jgi:hypothetical protein
MMSFWARAGMINKEKDKRNIAEIRFNIFAISFFID